MGSTKGHFNAQREINKYKLDHSTFDLIDVDKFHNTKWSTVFAYMWMWIWVFLSWILLGVDMYTCLNILVFHRWSSNEYQPYAYSVAKWIFTGCIIFQFVLLFYHWIWAIHTYRTKNIALAYVNSICRMLYTVKSYNYHCLFHLITTDNFFDWCCFLTYEQLDNALQILIADTPRQVINILTLRYYATDGDVSNDIIANIRNIASSNVRLSVILSFMCLSVVIWSIFFFIFVAGMIAYIPVKTKLRHRGYKLLKKYCCKVVNDNVRMLVLKNHKPKNTLLEQGILNLSELKENPLLNGSNPTFDDDFDYKVIPNHNLKGISYNDNSKLYDSYSMQSLNDPFKDPTRDSDKSNPFADNTSKESLIEKVPLRDPFQSTDSFATNFNRADSFATNYNESYKGESARGDDVRADSVRKISAPATAHRYDSQTSLHDTSYMYRTVPEYQDFSYSSSSLPHNMKRKPPAHDIEQISVPSAPPAVASSAPLAAPPPAVVPSAPPKIPSLSVHSNNSQDSLAPYPVRGVSLYRNNSEIKKPLVYPARDMVTENSDDDSDSMTSESHSTHSRGYPI